MNKQTIFDVILNKAITNPEKAITKDGSCFYRHENGSKCFVGLLIPDTVYTSDMERKGVDFLCDSFAFLKPMVLPTDMEYRRGIQFMEKLQKIHDEIHIIFWGEELRKVAREHKLIFMDEE